MALLSLLFMAIWTVVVVRIFSARATLSDRTYLSHIALGALLAVTAVPLAEKVIIPYPLNQYNYGYFGVLLRILIRNLVLLAPVLAYFFIRRGYRLISVADGFLLAFAVAFGFELVGGVLAASVAPASLKGLTLFPPWQFTWDPQQRFPILGLSGVFAIAGAAYAVALVSLAIVAALRFSGGRKQAVFSVAAVLLVVTAHEALWVQQLASGAYSPPATGWQWLFDSAMVHGKLTALVALTALAYFSAREIRWVANSLGAAPPERYQLIEEGQKLLSALLRGGPAAYRRASLRARIETQNLLAQAEMRRSGGDRHMFQAARLLDIKAGQVASSPIMDDGARHLISARDRRVIQFVWVALAVVILLNPRLPNWLPVYLWRFPLLNIQVPLLPLTVLDLALIAILLWWFVTGRAQSLSGWDPEEAARDRAEEAISFAAMGAALLVLFHVPLDNFYPPYNALAVLNRAPFPPLDSLQIPAVALLVAAATSSLTLAKTARWRNQASAEELRATLIRRALIVVNATIFMWLSIKVYVPVLSAFQKGLGPIFFDLFGRFGNVMMALLTVIVVFAVSLGVGFVLRQLTQRIESFLLGPAQA